MDIDSINLSEEQKENIRNLYNEFPDLILITKKVFNNDQLDGRSKEGRAVREFLFKSGLKYKTTKREIEKEIKLSEEQKLFIDQNSKNMTAFQMAKILFPDENINSVLSKECREIIKYLRNSYPEKIKQSESGIGIEYKPPENLLQAVSIINKSTAQDLDDKKLSTNNRYSIIAYIRFINSPRLIQIVNSYSDASDRDLFQSEFTRFTWDKPDLTADDIALYIGICQDIVTNKRLVQHMEKLNQMFENTEDNEDLTVRLADTIKAKSEEYDKVQKRIESVIKKLNGDRAVRLQKQGERSANFLSLVEAFQSEEERKRLLLIAKAQRQKIKNEADRLESLDEFKARILGISKQEVL
jgi:predicted GIY-YIG superfamily endonuclease